jgi:hypothetical protein
MKRIIIILIALLNFVHAQHIAILSVDIGLQNSIGQSGSARIVNQGEEAIPVLLSIDVRGQSGAVILQNISKPQTLQIGTNVFDLSDVAESLKRMQASGMERIQAAEVCLEVLDINKTKLSIQCNPVPVMVSIPPYLVYPFDGDVLESPSLVFSWTTPAPLPPKEIISYTLTVVELGRAGFSSSPALSIQQSPAFFKQANIPTNSLLYPPNAPRLEPGKRYAWQVSVETPSRPLGSTETWVFEIKEPKRLIPEELKSPFVDLKRKDHASIYPALEQVRFKFPNPYNEDQFALNISNGHGEPMPFERKWLEDLGNGLYALDLPLAAGFKDGAYYELEIRDHKGGYYTLKMRYILRNRIKE